MSHSNLHPLGPFSPSLSSPQLDTTQITHNSRNSTPARTTAPPGTQTSSSQMTNPLLNLLKFGSNTASPQASPQAVPTSRPEYFTGAKPSHAVSSTNHQDALLRLLNQTTARPDGVQHKAHGSTDTIAKQAPDTPASTSQENKHPSVPDAKKAESSGRHDSPIRLFGSNEASTPTPFEPVVSPISGSSEKPGPIFTYVNPFEQLAASSPRNVKSRTPTNGDKRKINSPSPAAVHASSRRKLTPSGSEVMQSIESPTPVVPGQPKDDRSQIEALIGIGAPSRDAETVAEALNDVGDKVDRQVESALAKAEEKAGLDVKQEKQKDVDQQILNDIEKRAHDVAVDVKQELDNDENQGLLEDTMPAPMAEAVKDVIGEAATGEVVNEREGNEGENTTTKEEASKVVQVHQFPMRPFVSIDLIQKDPADIKIREDTVMNVARFKKDFDQADRTLATATNDFIVYGMPKAGGVRIIQQDNGTNSLIFAKSQDRIFNVAISTAQSGSSLKSTQTIIATGVSGTVYWTTIAKPGEELSQEAMEKQGLIIPPITSQSDFTSGGQLKTRAKKSNRHPEFFAIGRGKSIQIIFTANAQSSEFVTKEGLMDTEKYFADRNLKVTTGKAGKDFTFSEDDSTIVSLDKAGKLRIWDIRDLTNDANNAVSLMTPIEVKTPILTYSTAHPTEKSWPTSVLLVDKLRPYTKGTALRYVIVGMKQNHTLQLWDLCLGKAVQELSFPHESETDAICSVTYHPASGIIAVGHPTRNSIYFIHLSAPKYNLSGMSQAKFVQRLANKDPTLPKAEATAIMSGMREFSFADKGQIRSLDLVPSSGEPSRAAEDDEDPTLFGLYVLHSKGVTCLDIKKEDLGWSKESRVLEPLDAEKEGLIVVKELRESSAVSATDPSVTSTNGETQASTTPFRAKSTSKEAAKSARSPAEVNTKTASQITDKAEKKKSKRNGVVDSEINSQVAATPPTSESYASAKQRPSTPTPQSTPSTSTKNPVRSDPEAIPASTTDRPNAPGANGDSISVGISGDFLDKELKKIQHGVSEEFNKVIERELETLYNRFSEDKRVQDAAGAAKQDAMLRLVSSTLSDNVEKSLSRIIQKNIQDTVVPSITDVTSRQIDEKLAAVMKQTLPEAIGRSLQSPQLLRSVSEQITKVVTGHVEQQFSATLSKNIIPAFTNLAVDTARNVTGDTERRVREQLQQAEVKHCEDSVKIDQLTNLVRGLSETVHTMAAAQSEFQLEILKQQQKAASDDRAGPRQNSLTPSESASMIASPEQEELDQVTKAMSEGLYEDATVMWLQSHQQVELFDNLFVRCNPSYLRHTTPLVVLSVAAAVTGSLETNIMERLIWLETVFQSIDIRNPEIQSVAGRILEVLSQRLEGEYMRIAEADSQNPALRKIPGLARIARELRVHVQ